jgi:hypothetical protein
MTFNEFFNRVTGEVYTEITPDGEGYTYQPADHFLNDDYGMLHVAQGEVVAFPTEQKPMVTVKSAGDLTYQFRMSRASYSWRFNVPAALTADGKEIEVQG